MFEPSVPASCERGTDATRAILPVGIDHEHRQAGGSTNSVESLEVRE